MRWCLSHLRTLQTNLPEIAFLGRSNVGKSSMLNTLFGEAVAKVSKTPGRTRQINIFKVASLFEDFFVLFMLLFV